jgi:hypothetical protein
MEMIDTLRYTKDLEKAGLAPEVAEMLVRGQLAMITGNVATKIDILSLKAEMREFSSKLDTQNAKFELQVQRMTNKLGIIVVSSLGALGLIITLLN